MADQSARLAYISLEGEALTRLSPILEADRAQAVADLQAENYFVPHGLEAGPYALTLSIQEGRLVFEVAYHRDDSNRPGRSFVLSLSPFRSLIKDYQMLVDSHIMAVAEGREARIQAIDMGRRGLHNEGATLMTERLASKIDIDFETARRLFTLVCVLHQRI